MPIHDWTKVPDGTFHDFHITWIPQIKHALNHGVLPAGYYALAEQSAGKMTPDLISLHQQDRPTVDQTGDEGGGTAVAVQPPRVQIAAKLQEPYAQRAKRITIRHVSGHRVVALIEFVSAGNKASRRDMEAFAGKVVAALQSGVHVLVIDLHLPTSRDPQGIHGVIWEALGGEAYRAPPGKPLTLASYVGNPEFAAYIEPVAVGDPLPPVPLFLSPERYVEVPLEDSYMYSVAEIPPPAREPLESS